MSRFLKGVISIVTGFLVGLGVYLVLPDHSEYVAERPVFGVATSPSTSSELVGRYYQGDGLGFNVHLNLFDEGTYSVIWDGCLGEYGEVEGTWALHDRFIDLVPSSESGMVGGQLRKLETLRFEDAWILVPLDLGEWAFYDVRGVAQDTCLQLQND